MASSSGTSLEQRRWLVVGIALHHVLTPCLRDKIKNDMTPFYQHSVRNFGMDKQTFAAYKKTIPPSAFNLNYGSINSNATLHRHPRHYDYCVKDEVSLAKLFMKPFMAHFNAFDNAFDSSSALAVLCGAAPFTTVKTFAEDVRSKVRNEWAHCDFTAWTEAHYDTCFDLMEVLVTNLGIAPADEAKTLDELKLWKSQGLEICLGKPLDVTLFQTLRTEVQALADSLDDHKEEQDQNIRATLDLFKTEFERAIVSLQEKQSSLEITCEELKYNQDMIREEVGTRKNEQKMNWEITQKVQSLCKTLEEKSAIMQRDLDVLMTTVNTMMPPEDFIHVVFDAPEKSRWFTGRENEMKSLQRCLPLEGSEELAILSPQCDSSIVFLKDNS